eukprot:283153_1
MRHPLRHLPAILSVLNHLFRLRAKLLLSITSNIMTNNVFNGVDGFVQVFGDAGYLFNASTVWAYEGQQPMLGYVQFRDKTLHSRTLMSIEEMHYDVQVLQWSPYHVYYKSKLDIRFLSLADSYPEETIESWCNKTWFADDSGIMKKDWHASSTSSLMNDVRGT